MRSQFSSLFDHTRMLVVVKTPQHTNNGKVKSNKFFEDSV